MSDRYEWLEQQRAESNDGKKAKDGYLSAEDGVRRGSREDWNVRGVQGRTYDDNKKQMNGLQSRLQVESFTDNEALTYHRKKETSFRPHDRRERVLETQSNLSNCRPLNQKKVMFKLDDEANRGKAQRSSKNYDEKRPQHNRTPSSGHSHSSSPPRASTYADKNG